ncbi:MAG: tripartite tricarboxylate transporter TctB family protein [Betaproteobacteria bacterium]|nr:tripartite tricarboxylate transporter TctB family protein [Betaproteobacteria bacterium]
MTSLRRLEIGVGVALLLLGVFAAWEGARMPQGTAGLPGPGVMPVALGVVLALCSVALMTISARARVAGEPVAIGHRRITAAVLALFAAGLLWESAGFLVTSTLFLFVLLWILSTLGWWRSLVAAMLGALAARFVFQNVLNVVLPALPFAY